MTTEFNGGWFYYELKEALRHLQLSWGEMDRVHVEINEGTITFSGNGRSITVQVCPDDQA